MTFGVLIKAQALGDGQALRDTGRRVIRFHLGAEPAAALRALTEGLDLPPRRAMAQWRNWLVVTP